MADITYTVNQDLPENIPGFEQYSQSDKDLIAEFQVNNLFDPTKHTVELHILTLSDELVESTYEYTNYKQLGNAQSAGKAGASILTIDPVADSKAYGYPNGGVKLLYHFINNLYATDKTSPEFYIESISPDRTELRLNSLVLSKEDIISYTTKIRTNLQSQSYFSDFRLNFKQNDLLIGINIDTVDLNSTKAVVVKLYEPLPTTYAVKSKLTIVESVSDSVAYEVDSLIQQAPVKIPTLRPANFNIEVSDESVIPTGYFSFDELFSYPINNTNSQVYSLFNEKGIEVSVDYTNYADFVHFSSAQERLINFKYKLDLLNSYSASMASIGGVTSGSVGLSGSVQYYDSLMTGVVNNFDHYERYLYYESGSTSWPKSNTTKPYVNQPSNTAEAITWYANQNTEALYHDQTNYNSLVNTIPTYLREDENNENYLTFVHMIGQHFDNLWLYSKAVTDKYDGDNRINRGISKDLVGEALKNFGVKLYTSNNSIQDLFSTFTGQSYQSGSEVINHYMTANTPGVYGALPYWPYTVVELESPQPIQPIGYDDYQKEVYKRIYHNLPLLLKSKGTERGLRALINCFGIPADVLDIKLYGGHNTTERPFYGDYQYVTSSLDKIRLDNTGSIVTGNTLSETVSITKRDSKYTDDLHTIEVGFSPTDNVDNYIISQSSATYNIDQYIGDPSSLYLDNYEGLEDYAETILGDLTQYNLQDYVRLIKFFDNVVFKMVKDFIPARSVADTGVIIKPNLLNRNKAKSVSVSTTIIDYTGSIDTANISGSHGESYLDRDINYTTNYARNVQTADGLVSNKETFERPKYNGELANSGILISNGELNAQNPFKTAVYAPFTFSTYIVKTTEEQCNLQAVLPTPRILTTRGASFTQQNLFTGFNQATQYTQQFGTGTVSSVTLPITFSDVTKVGQLITIGASHAGANGEVAVTCVATNQVLLNFCELTIVPDKPTLVNKNDTYYLSQFITIGAAQLEPAPDGTSLNRVIITVNGVEQIINRQGNCPLNFSAYDQDDVVTIIVSDRYFNDPLTFTYDAFCTQQVTVTINDCALKSINYEAEQDAIDTGGTVPKMYFQYSYLDPTSMFYSPQYLAHRTTTLYPNGTPNYNYTRSGDATYSNSGTGVDSFFNGVTNKTSGNTNGNTKYSVYIVEKELFGFNIVPRALVVDKGITDTYIEGFLPKSYLQITIPQSSDMVNEYYNEQGIFTQHRKYYKITATTPLLGGISCTETVYVYPRPDANLTCTDPSDPSIPNHCILDVTIGNEQGGDVIGNP